MIITRKDYVQSHEDNPLMSDYSDHQKLIKFCFPFQLYLVFVLDIMHHEEYLQFETLLAVVPFEIP